ncbi:MAG: hypothetical protein MZV70_52925 [Desulfobacterales bacterium]|nr:hypothetical protein [Desulfobacterales bacterium]
MKRLPLVEKALERLTPLESSCTLCPRDCRIDRTKGADGRLPDRTAGPPSPTPCSISARSPSSAARPGRARSSSAGCNLKCLFCQNYQLSWLARGHADVTDAELAALMLDLQGQGARNINLVSPSHVVLPVLRALRIALAEVGLSIPLVWNSNGYDSLEVVQALEGIVDVYLPDLKYVSAALSEEIFRRAGLLRPGLRGRQGDVAAAARPGPRAGRHGPPGASSSATWSSRARSRTPWPYSTGSAENLSPFIGLSLMSQYHPCFRAPEEIRRGVSAEEYGRAAGSGAGARPRPSVPPAGAVPGGRTPRSRFQEREAVPLEVGAPALVHGGRVRPRRGQARSGVSPERPRTPRSWRGPPRRPSGRGAEAVSGPRSGSRGPRPSWRSSGPSARGGRGRRRPAFRGARPWPGRARRRNRRRDSRARRTRPARSGLAAR